jgi:hypothetical protein
MMMSKQWLAVARAGVLVLLMCSAHAAVLVNEAHVVTVNEGVAATLPAPRSFTVNVAGDYNVVLNDVGKQANSGAYAFSSLSLVIYQNSQLIKVISVPEATANSKTDQLTLAAGTYSAQVLGVTTGAGLYSAFISDTNTQLLSLAGSIATASSSVGNDLSSLQPELSLVAGRSYSISVNDLGFPAALNALNVAIVTDGSNVVCPLTAASTNACNFVAGNTNKLLAIAQKAASAAAGMYSIKIVDNSTNSSILASVYPVGTLPNPVSISLPITGAYQLITTDLKTPDPLNNLQTLLLQDLNVLANQTATATSQLSSFNANLGLARLYVLGNATSNGGTYGVQVTQNGSVVYSNASAVSSNSATTQTGYFFNATLPAAGSYTLSLGDLNFPQTFKRLSLAVTQGVVTMGTLSTTGAITLNASAPGDIQINVIATPVASGQGLFGITLAATGSSSKILNVTQGVGGSFHTIPVTVTTAGSYKLNVVDMQAPQLLGQLLVAVTRDTQFLGEVIGSSSVNIDATPGNYVVNVIAGADAAKSPFGMYGVAFNSAPMLTLNASATSVTAGSSVTLTWNSADVSSCTASDGWSGTKAINGSESVGPLTSDARFTLTCVSATGNENKSVNVTVRAVTASATTQASSDRGGGAMQWWMLALLLFVIGVSRLLAKRRSQTL